MNVYKESAGGGSGGMVDCVNLLLYSVDPMACLCVDHDQAAGSNALLLGSRRYMAGNSYYLAVGNGGMEARRRNDAICRHLADTLGKKTGKKIELTVVVKVFSARNPSCTVVFYIQSLHTTFQVEIYHRPVVNKKSLNFFFIGLS